LNEKPLHADLKAWIAEDGDAFEVPIDGFVIDIARDGELIEIQTGSASALRRKLSTLIKRHRVRLVLPVSERKTLTVVDEDGHAQQSRLSPRRLTLLDVFMELVSLRDVLGDSNLSIDALLIHEEEIRRPRRTQRGRYPKKWEVQERRLIDVVDHVSFHHPADFLGILPATLEEPFTTADLAAAVGRPRRLAQQVAYCLREMGLLIPLRRTRQGIEYRRNFGAVPCNDSDGSL
jgi:hypothetical protein